MTTITDSRDLDKGCQDTNRARFLDRARKKIDYGFTSIKDVDNGRDVIFEGNEEISLDYVGNKRSKILVGNPKFIVGDKIWIDAQGGGGAGGGGDGSGGGGENGEDSFVFYLDKDEFLNLYFDDLELPNLVKEQIKLEVKYSLKTGGFTKDGIPARLAIKKSFEQAFARRIANKRKGHKSPFLDETDLRYTRQYKVAEPSTKAVMFCLMDVSGSMTQELKDLAKKFYTLLYLFLTRKYKEVDVVFVRYHTSAKECDEHAFFYSRETGGTMFSEAQKLMVDIINERYPLDRNNIYLAHTSDGDLWDDKETKLIMKNMEEYYHMLQYTAYIQVETDRLGDFQDLRDVYKSMYDKDDKVGIARVSSSKDIFEVFRKLFRKK